MSKYSQGPWVASESEATPGFWHIYQADQGAGRGDVVYVTGSMQPLATEANARLIAAAPELLEFAEHVRALAFDFLNEGTRPNHHHMRDLAWEAEKIVSKATRATQPLPTMSEEK